MSFIWLTWICFASSCTNKYGSNQSISMDWCDVVLITTREYHGWAQIWRTEGNWMVTDRTEKTTILKKTIGTTCKVDTSKIVITHVSLSMIQCLMSCLVQTAPARLPETTASHPTYSVLSWWSTLFPYGKLVGWLRHSSLTQTCEYRSSSTQHASGLSKCFLWHILPVGMEPSATVPFSDRTMQSVIISMVPFLT